MKAFLNYFLLIVIISLVTSGCEKDNITPDDDPLHPDKKALRISKIADNPAMIDPLWTFEYNEKGLVTEIGGDGGGTATITYNENDLPVKIGYIDVTWTENSFSLNDGEYLNNETYTLDANGRIISIDDDYEARWQDDEAEIYYLNDGIEEWAQTRELTEYYHPLSAINLAIINAGEISWIYDECEWVFQNEYCLSWNSSADEGSADYDYVYNADGYPTELLIVETTDGGIYKFYFEYKTDQ